MIRYLAFALVLILTGCDTTAYRDSFTMTPTDRPTVPRARYSRDRQAGRLATKADLAKVPCMWVEVPGASAYYDPAQNLIVFGEHPYMVTVVHESDHCRQWHAGMRNHMDLEISAMKAETAELMREGWTDQQIRALSPNNQHVSDQLMAEIRVTAETPSP